MMKFLPTEIKSNLVLTCKITNKTTKNIQLQVKYLKNLTFLL